MKKNTFLKFYLSTLFIVFSTVLYAQVGIDTSDPKTQLDVNGAISLREGSALVLTNGNNNNISLGTTAFSFYRITGPTSDFNIGSMVPITGADGQIITLENTTSNAMTIRHNAGGVGVNRVYCPGGRNLVLTGQYTTVTLQYNASQTRWLVTNYADNRYGDNIQTVKGTTNTTIYAYLDTVSFTDMNSMTITFTPNHSTVYLSFSAAGYVSPLINNTAATTNQTAVYFRVRNGSTTLGHTISVASDYDFDDIFGEAVLTAWNAHFTMFPVTVTPGVSTTLKIQWRADTTLGNFSPSTTNPIVYCTPATDAFSHRSLTIFD